MRRIFISHTVCGRVCVVCPVCVCVVKCGIYKTYWFFQMCFNCICVFATSPYQRLYIYILVYSRQLAFLLRSSVQPQYSTTMQRLVVINSVLIIQIIDEMKFI